MSSEASGKEASSGDEVYISDEEQQPNGNKSPENKSPSSEEPTVKCELCLQQFNGQAGLDNHKKTSQYHKRMVLRADEKKKGLIVYTKVKVQEQKDAKPELLDWLPVIEEPLIGLEHIIEVRRKNQNQTTYYICDICGMSQISILEHVLTKGHRLECLLEVYEDLEDHILAKVQLSEDEKAYLTKLCKEKIYPGSGHSPLKGSEVTTLVQKVVKELMKKLGQKDIRVVKETAASTHTPRQQAPLTSQIKGHKDDKYPEKLKKKLAGKGNFCKKTEPAPSATAAKPDSAGRGRGQGPGRQRPNQQQRRQGNQQMSYAQLQAGGSGLMGMYQGHGMGAGRGRGRPHINQQGFDFGPQVGMQGWAEPVAMNSAGGGQYQGQMSGSGGPQYQRITLLDWLHRTAQKLDTDTVCVSEECELSRQVIVLLHNGLEIFHTRGSSEQICTHLAPMDSSALTLMEWLRLTVKFFDTAWLCSPREVTMAQVIISQLETEIEKFMQRAQKSMTTIGRGRGRPVGLLGDSPGFGPQQPYTGGYNQMVDHSYDPYENASYGGGYNYGQDLASKFGAMSLGNNMAGGDNVQNRVMNPHTGKLYIRKQGKSHYKMPLNK